MTANLFDDRNATVNGRARKQRTGTLQAKLAQHLRTKGSITEPEYRSEIGGKSVSAAIHNLRLAGILVKGVEFIDRLKEYDKDGNSEMRYHLRTIQPAEVAKVAEVAPEPVPEPVPEITPLPTPDAITRYPELNFIQLVSVDLIGGDCHLRVVMADGSILTKPLTAMERRFIQAGLSAFD